MAEGVNWRVDVLEGKEGRKERSVHNWGLPQTETTLEVCGDRPWTLNKKQNEQRDAEANVAPCKKIR